MQRLLKRDRAAIPSLEADEEFRADEGRCAPRVACCDSISIA